MIIPFDRRHGQEIGTPRNREEAHLLARLHTADKANQDRESVAAAQDRVWQRLVNEHPALGQPARHPSRPTPIVSGVVAPASGRSLLPIGRRAPGGWRAALDIASVAVLVIGLLVSARGAGIMPNGGNPNPMMTQSVAAATPTTPLAAAEPGTNQQPGPGPRLSPILVESTGEPRRIQGDPVLANGIVYALSPLTTETFLVAGYDPATLAEVWSSEQTGSAVDLAVNGDAVSLVARQADGRGTLARLSTAGDGDDWMVELPFDPIDVTSSADTVLVSGHDEATGTPNAGQPGDRSRLLAVDPMDGSTRWDIGLTNPAGVEPLLTDDGIYYTTANGAVKAIELDSGAARWTTGTGGLRITSDAVASGTLLYVIRPDGVVMALDRLTGEERWGTGIRSQDLSVPPLVTAVGGWAVAVPSPVLALSQDGDLLVGYVWANGDLSSYRDTEVPLDPNRLIGRILALDAATGATLWSQPVSSPFEPLSGNLALNITVADDQVFVYGGSSVSAHSTTSGEEVWNVSTEGTISGRLIVTDQSVLLTYDAGLAALREPVRLPGTATPAATPGA